MAQPIGLPLRSRLGVVLQHEHAAKAVSGEYLHIAVSLPRLKNDRHPGEVVSGPDVSCNTADDGKGSKVDVSSTATASQDQPDPPPSP